MLDKTLMILWTKIMTPVMIPVRSKMLKNRSRILTALTFNWQEEREDQQREAGLILEETDLIETSQ